LYWRLKNLFEWLELDNLFSLQLPSNSIPFIRSELFNGANLKGIWSDHGNLVNGLINRVRLKGWIIVLLARLKVHALNAHDKYLVTILKLVLSIWEQFNKCLIRVTLDRGN
jgi:hypothetical protein